MKAIAISAFEQTADFIEIPAPGEGEVIVDVANGELRVPITRMYPLADVGQAMTDFSAGALGKLSIAVR